MLTRREFLEISAKASLIGSLWPHGCASQTSSTPETLVNDIHSQLNPTRVRSIVKPISVEEIQASIRRARREGRSLSLAGGMHAMGGQQFGDDTILLDMRDMNRVLSFDRAKGEVEVEAGIQWPELIDYLLEAQKEQQRQWGIIQKQTGADRLTLGGALAANVHGRGLHLKPIIGDVESFVLVGAGG